MTWYGEHPRLRDAEDPSDPVWQWFILNGPHGDRFAWHKESAVMPRDLDLLSQFILERAEGDSEFPEKARRVALRALELEDPVLVRTGIQVLAILGQADDLARVRQLVDHLDPKVAKDARCCLFERGIKLRGPTPA
jgi:hypothetical protein